MKKLLTFPLILSFFTSFSYAEDLFPETVNLSEPNLKQTGSLMHALKNRSSQRHFDSKPLPLSEISNILWAANGINRPEDGYRTAPSTQNKQAIDIYLVNNNGIYLYDYKNNTLVLKVKGDYRKETGLQPFVKDAPINLVYVANLNKFKSIGKSDQEIKMWAAFDTGAIMENVYLYCANAKLATVVRGSVPRSELSKIMQLNSDQEIMLAQSIGYQNL